MPRRGADVARDGTPFLGGWHWQALALAAVESTLVMAGSVWLLALAQRWFPTGSRVLKRCGQAWYLALMLQVPVLISLHIAMRPFPLPAAVRGLLVGLTAVVAHLPWPGSSRPEPPSVGSCSSSCPGLAAGFQVRAR